MEIDARGKACPQPVMVTEEALTKITEGIIEVVVDNEESALTLPVMQRRRAYMPRRKKRGRAGGSRS